MTWESIGFQARSTWSDGLQYTWHEYLLFNPYQGYRYLVFYDGHWNFVRPLPGLPRQSTSGGRPAAVLGTTTFKHFQHGEAQTTFVMGEFPWAIESGEKVVFDDFVAPPRILSREANADEVTWSIGDYIEGTDVWKAFAMPGAPPQVYGVYSDQPSPYPAKMRAVWSDCWKMLLVWLVVLIVFSMRSHSAKVYETTMTLAAGTPGEASRMSGEFEWKVPANVEVEIRADSEDAAPLDVAMIDEASGHAVVLDGGSHDEIESGGWRDHMVATKVEPGKYTLRLEPDPGAPARESAYQIQVKQTSGGVGWLWLALPLLLIPPIITSVRAGTFETKRWQESDYAPGE